MKKSEEIFILIAYINFGFWIMSTAGLMIFNTTGVLEINSGISLWTLVTCIAFAIAYQRSHPYNGLDAMDTEKEAAHEIVKDYGKIIENYSSYQIISNSILPCEQEKIKKAIRIIFDDMGTSAEIADMKIPANIIKPVKINWEEVGALYYGYGFLSNFVEDEVAKPFMATQQKKQEAILKNDDSKFKKEMIDMMIDMLSTKGHIYVDLTKQINDKSLVLELEILNYISKYKVFRKYSRDLKKSVVDVLSDHTNKKN